MTANAFEEDRKRALEVGMDGYIAKPIHMESVLDALQKGLAGKHWKKTDWYELTMVMYGYIMNITIHNIFDAQEYEIADGGIEYEIRKIVSER